MIWNSFGINFSVLVVCLLITVGNAQNWRGNTEPYKKWDSLRCRLCICQYPTYCGAWRNFTCNVLVTKLGCLRGWTHNGDYNCNIPICRPNCGSVGECVAPAKCDCKGQAIGQYCQTLICSYARPCYPGNCYSNNLCKCTGGFTKENSASEYGCLKIDTNNKPYIGKSTSVIKHIRKTDNKFLFYFLLDGTDERMSNLIVWSNQRVFNIMDFTFEVSYEPPEPLAERPVYVHKTAVGITEGKVLLRVLDYKDEEHPVQKYDINCPSSNPANPQQLFNCTIENEEFRTLIEHADTLKVTFEARNGGYRQMNNQGNLLPEDTFIGQTSRKNVYFKFDFQAPKHCTEDDIGGYTATDCVNSTMLHVPKEFTKEPITVRWKGWTDDKYGSKMWMYYLELHKLEVKDATLELTERNPIKPMASNQTLHMGNMSHYQTFTPLEPGMYSILLEVRDVANNSRIARRFVLYDKKSDVELNQGSPNGLHVSSAQNHTGFKWQSAGSEGQNTSIVVNWAGYFMNKAHEDGHYNNEIQTFKPQFEDLEDDGILYTRKFVNALLDDMEGARTRDPIANIHGIVKFEYQFTRDIGTQIPEAVWTKVEPISETTTIKEQMSSGDQLKIWVRAQDVLGNTKMDSTIVTTDFTKPITSSADDNITTYIVVNTNVKPFNYSSSVYLEAFDTESGVRDIGVNITIKMQGVSNIYVSKMVKANTDDKRHPDRDSECVTSRDKTTCFLKKQTVNIDNCWLTVPNQALLSSASATIDVIAYNQAMLPSSVSFTIPAITALDGLVSYNGPESPRVENVKTGSFRIVWDFPIKLSCYAIQTSIILVLFKKASNGNIELVTHVIPGSNTYFDVANLDADTEYLLDFISQIGDKKNPPMKLTARTSTTPLIDCSPDDNACNVDANSQCNIEIGKCVCKPGFEVKKTICEDIDECTANTDKCDDTNGSCTNTAGSFACSCNAGFNLQADGFTCKVRRCLSDTDYMHIQWEKGIPGRTSKHKCPTGYRGNVTRYCTINGIYQDPVYNCTKISIENIFQKLIDAKNTGQVNLVDVLDELSNETSGTDENSTLLIGDINVAVNTLAEIVDVVTVNTTNLENVTDSYIQTVNNILDESTTQTWKVNINQTGSGADIVLKTIDRFVEKILTTSKNVTAEISKSNLYLKMAYVQSCNEALNFPDRGKEGISEWARSRKDMLVLDCDGTVESFSGIMYRNLSQIIPSSTKNTNSTMSDDLHLNAPVISFTFYPNIKRDLISPVEIKFQLYNNSLDNARCSFWKESKSETSQGYWSDEGCRLKKFDKDEGVVVCVCDHLTNFAVLMSPSTKPIEEEHKEALSIISMLGCIVSMICIVLNVAIHAFFWRFIKSVRYIIHMNLSCWLIIAYILFLAGINRTENKGVCTAMAVLLHLVFLIVFFGMLAEGCYLSYTVLKPLSTIKSGMPLMISSYVLAVIIVVISMGVSQLHGYGNEQTCWLSTDTGLIWAFLAPVLVVIVVNFIIVVLVIRTMCGTTAMSKKSHKGRAKAALRCILVLMPVMGLTWGFGVLSLNSDTIAFQYIFALLNSFQGLLIFIFHCVLDKKIKGVFLKQRHRWFQSTQTF